MDLGEPGWADFWFENENEKPVTVGLYGTSCECSGAKVYLLPPGSKMAPGQEAALEKTATATQLTLRGTEGVAVRPKQVGWVRLEWSGKNRKNLVSESRSG